jgi:hypothetical protein
LHSKDQKIAALRRKSEALELLGHAHQLPASPA